MHIQVVFASKWNLCRNIGMPCEYIHDLHQFATMAKACCEKGEGCSLYM